MAAAIYIACRPLAVSACAVEVAMELQLTSTQQELKDTLELCGQYKILVEERISSRIRCMCVVCVSVYLYVCCVRVCVLHICMFVHLHLLCVGAQVGHDVMRLWHN